MEHRKIATRTIPAQPERVMETLVSEYTCDSCGNPMPEHNASGGFLPPAKDTIPRNKLQVWLTREHFSGDSDGNQSLQRDYCDLCLPGIWKDIMHILRYDPTDSLRET